MWNGLHLCYIEGFIVLDYWWNSESVSQLISKKISEQVTDMVHELQTANVSTKPP